MKLNCIIVEDEPLAAQKLQDFISKVPFLCLTECFDNGIEAMNFLKNNQVDVLFLDIQMELLTGIQLLEILSPKSYIIITTAYSDYALKGYELNVFDYLLKPFSFDRFLLAVNKIYDSNNKKKSDTNIITHIFVKSEHRLENICLNDILYIEGMQGYLKIFSKDRKILTKQSIKSMIEQLPENKFVQVHKSFIVAISKIDTIEKSRITIKDKIIPIGDSYRENFFLSIM